MPTLLSFAHLAILRYFSKSARWTFNFSGRHGAHLGKISLTLYEEIKPPNIICHNIANGEINTNEMVYVDQSRVSDAQRIRIGDIIVCASSGSQSLVGKAAINKNLTRECAHGAFCLLIRCNNTILPKYLNIYLQTALYRNQIESLSCGSNILNIKADHLTSLDIPIPDIKQQSDFVTIIEQADKSKLV